MNSIEGAKLIALLEIISMLEKKGRNNNCNLVKIAFDNW